MLAPSVDLLSSVPSYSISLDTAVYKSQNGYAVPKPKTTGHSIRQTMIDDAVAFRSLHDGWLGPGSQKIAEEVTDKVRAVALLLEQIDGLPNPELTPNANGTISLEWENDRGEVYIEFGKTRISGFLRIEDAPTVYFKDVSSLQSSFYAEIRDLLYPTMHTYSITIPGATFDSYALK